MLINTHLTTATLWKILFVSNYIKQIVQSLIYNSSKFLQEEHAQSPVFVMQAVVGGPRKILKDGF